MVEQQLVWMSMQLAKAIKTDVHLAPDLILNSLKRSEELPAGRCFY